MRAALENAESRCAVAHALAAWHCRFSPASGSSLHAVTRPSCCSAGKIFATTMTHKIAVIQLRAKLLYEVYGVPQAGLQSDFLW